MLLDALFHCREGSAGPPLKNVMQSIVQLCFILGDFFNSIFIFRLLLWQIPKKGKIYSVNEGNAKNWDAPTTKYVESAKFPTDGSSPKSLRYIGRYYCLETNSEIEILLTSKCSGTRTCLYVRIERI
jgi:hypothetical protein